MDDMRQQTKYLILAWGNPGRGDDAVGLVIAESLEGCVGGQVEIQCFHQLGPELSEDVAAVDHVIFIDAHEQPAWADIVVREVDPAADYTPDSHSSGPEELLALAKALYHRRPRGTLVAARAYDTTFGAPLSAKTQALVAEAHKAVLGLLATHHPNPSVQS
jgi:hydrogenase maturation protease